MGLLKRATNVRSRGEKVRRRLLVQLERINRIRRWAIIKRDWRGRYAVCAKCGETYYINPKDVVTVNGHEVSECVSCAARERGVKLW
jgi:hypothetical protein